MIKKISERDYSDLSFFLNNAGKSLESFRYFKSRSLDSIKQHLVTVLLYEDFIPVGYAHIDTENNIQWLGIAISYSKRGRGYGKLLMEYLIDFTLLHKIEIINLSVDEDNSSARTLYEHFGFKLTNISNNTIFLSKQNIADVYLSSICFKDSDFDKIENIALENDFNIEFSSGLLHDDSNQSRFLNSKLKRLIHNYFPAPKTPFVLNLASENDQIRIDSINHTIRGLRLAKMSNVQFYSVHAGFCIDPLPSQLGNRIEFSPNFNKKYHLDLFINSLKYILEQTNDLDTILLIENNVISHSNFEQHFSNPLLCCSSEELLSVFSELENERLKLLLDTAHLKVSCQTLGLNINEELNNIKAYVNAVHHSDNNGFSDTNDKIGNDYWFFEHVHNFRQIDHVIEVKNINIDEMCQQVNLLKDKLWK